MGVKKLFDPRYADLTGFFASSNATDNGTLRNTPSALRKGVTINSVLHKTAITVTEEGTRLVMLASYVG